MHLRNLHITFCAVWLLCLPVTAQQPLNKFYDPYFTIPVLKPGETPAQKCSSLIFLRAVASKNPVYIGEAFLVEYKLYRLINTQPSPGKQPSFYGCSVLELSPLNDSLTETLDGKKYHVLLLRKVQLTPLREGPIMLDQASVNNIVQFASANNARILQNVPFEAISKPVTITVKPLPEKDRPADFSGIIGNFNIAAKADTDTLPAGENDHLSLVIKGAGNITAITLPAINWPAGTEHFEAAATQHLAHEDFPAQGDKTFYIPFVGAKEGDVVIPPVYFTFFNTKTQQYDSVHTNSINIHFTKARPKQTLHEIITEDITNRKYLWIVPAIAVVVALVLIITGKKQRKEKKQRQEPAVETREPLPVTLPPLEKTDYQAEVTVLGAVENDHAFFGGAKELLTRALRQKLNSFAFYEADILQELEKNSQNKVLVETVRQMYKICNQNLYTPVVNKEQRGTLQDALTEVIKQLEA